MLRELCGARTNLINEDIELLESIEVILPYISDITTGDVFIDVMDKNHGYMFAVAQSRPIGGLSVYRTNTVGLAVLRENEPAVYHSYENGMLVRDLKGITQENKIVKQDVVPIKNVASQTIGVLICEKDISRSVQQDKKYRKLAKDKENSNALFNGDYTRDKLGKITLREIHHRIKNNLQMIASILNIQSRLTDSIEMKQAFKESSGRVLSIASIHDILTNTENDEMIYLKPLIERIRYNMQSLALNNSAVIISIIGDDIKVSSDKATSIALIVNELVTNALTHGFPENKNSLQGQIIISISKGHLFSTISVEDNGVGFDLLETEKNSLGLQIVSLTVRDKLNGKLRFISNDSGTKVMFDFKI